MHEIFHLYGKDAKIENFELCYAVTAVRPPLRIRTYTEVCGLKLQRLQSDPPRIRTYTVVCGLKLQRLQLDPPRIRTYTYTKVCGFEAAGTVPPPKIRNYTEVCGVKFQGLQLIHAMSSVL